MSSRAPRRRARRRRAARSPRRGTRAGARIARSAACTRPAGASCVTTCSTACPSPGLLDEPRHRDAFVRELLREPREHAGAVLDLEPEVVRRRQLAGRKRVERAPDRVLAQEAGAGRAEHGDHVRNDRRRGLDPARARALEHDLADRVALEHDRVEGALDRRERMVGVDERGADAHADAPVDEHRLADQLHPHVERARSGDVLVAHRVDARDLDLLERDLRPERDRREDRHLRGRVEPGHVLGRVGLRVPEPLRLGERLRRSARPASISPRTKFVVPLTIPSTRWTFVTTSDSRRSLITGIAAQTEASKRSCTPPSAAAAWSSGPERATSCLFAVTTGRPGGGARARAQPVGSSPPMTSATSAIVRVACDRVEVVGQDARLGRAARARARGRERARGRRAAGGRSRARCRRRPPRAAGARPSRPCRSRAARRGRRRTRRVTLEDFPTESALARRATAFGEADELVRDLVRGFAASRAPASPRPSRAAARGRRAARRRAPEPARAPAGGRRSRRPPARSSARSAPGGRRSRAGRGRGSTASRSPRAPTPSRRRARSRGRPPRARRRSRSAVASEDVVGTGDLRTERLVVALAGDVQDGGAALAERVDGELVERLRAGEPAEDREHRAVGGKPETRPRLLAARRRGARGGTGRPTTRYFAPSRPGIAYARKTRRANGAASRFASPRWASASVSAAGIPRSRAASTIGPATYPPRAEHDVGPAPREDPRARERRARPPARARGRDRARAGAGSPRSRTCRARTPPQEPAATRRGRATRRTSPSLRARAALPRLRARAGRARRFLRLRSGTRAWTTFPLTAMLRSIPTPASSTTRLEPPYETNGRGMPVSGAIPSTAARLTAACPHTSAVSPAARSFPNGSRQRSAMRKPAIAKTAKAAMTSGGPDEPELLADDREDHVRVRLGQVQRLRDALAQPLARDPARADPDHRLDDLEAGALGVAPRDRGS